MHLSQLLQDYGYYAVFFAGLLEGETILLLGSYAVHQGYLKMLPLIACGASAAFLSDQFYFFLGRRKGAQVLARHPALERRAARAFAFVERRPILTVMLMRFAWGLRIVLPVALGMSPMRAAVYVPLSAVASVLWAAVVCCGGVAISGTVHHLFGSLRPYEHWLIGGALLIGLVVAVRHLRMA
jgi:membrane protein DedA with SNARE-associated domain